MLVESTEPPWTMSEQTGSLRQPARQSFTCSGRWDSAEPLTDLHPRLVGRNQTYFPNLKSRKPFLFRVLFYYLENVSSWLVAGILVI